MEVFLVVRVLDHTVVVAGWPLSRATCAGHASRRGAHPRPSNEKERKSEWLTQLPEPREDARSKNRARRILLEAFSAVVKFLDLSSFACGQGVSLVKLSS